jgi:hypothetical protein
MSSYTFNIYDANSKYFTKSPNGYNVDLLYIFRNGFDTGFSGKFVSNPSYNFNALTINEFGLNSSSSSIGFNSNYNINGVDLTSTYQPNFVIFPGPLTQSLNFNAGITGVKMIIIGGGGAGCNGPQYGQSFTGGGYAGGGGGGFAAAKYTFANSNQTNTLYMTVGGGGPCAGNDTNNPTACFYSYTGNNPYFATSGTCGQTGQSGTATTISTDSDGQNILLQAGGGGGGSISSGGAGGTCSGSLLSGSIANGNGQTGYTYNNTYYTSGGYSGYSNWLSSNAVPIFDIYISNFNLNKLTGTSAVSNIPNNTTFNNFLPQGITTSLTHFTKLQFKDPALATSYIGSYGNGTGWNSNSYGLYGVGFAYGVYGSGGCGGVRPGAPTYIAFSDFQNNPSSTYGPGSAGAPGLAVIFPLYN